MKTGQKAVSFASSSFPRSAQPTRGAVLYSPNAHSPLRLGLAHSGGNVAIACGTRGAGAFLYRGPGAEHAAVGLRSSETTGGAKTGKRESD